MSLFPSSSLSRHISTSSTKFRDVVDRKLMLKSMPKEDQGTAGEKAVDIDTLITG